MKQCDVCKKPFKNARGVIIHQLRNKTCGGKEIPWGSTKGQKAKKRNKVGKNGESGREAIRQILSDHPQGLPLPQICDGLKERGFKVSVGYVSQAAANDPTLARVERGIYRLKKNALRGLTSTGKAVVEAAKTEATSIASLSRETLLLRNEQLEIQNRALQDAHQALLRGICL